jgi:hypothetical protein
MTLTMMAFLRELALLQTFVGKRLWKRAGNIESREATDGNDNFDSMVF